MTEEERDFLQDVREKKRTASGVYHRASRRKGYKGAVKLPLETMGRQARDQYTKGGDVVEINLKQGIKWNDLKKMAPETQRKVLLEAGRLYGYSGYKIAIASDVSNGTVCKLVRDLGIAEELEERRKTITPEEREAKKQRLLLLVGETTKAPEPTEKPSDPPKAEERPPIFHLETVLQPSAAGAWFSGLSMALRGMPDGELVRVTVTVEEDLK